MVSTPQGACTVSDVCRGDIHKHAVNHTRTHTGASSQNKFIHVLHSSEYAQTTFAVLDPNKCLVAENSLDTIFLHLKQFYTTRKGQRVDVKGTLFDVRGYIVKLGSIVIGTSNKGIVVEVRLCPLSM